MAQNLLKCQFCKISSNVKWKCETCDVFFCDPCRINTHALLKNSHGHAVTDYKDIDTECSDKVNLKTIPCSTHPEHSCVVYCRNCDKSLCPSCLINPSDQEELIRIYDIRRESLTELRQQIENILPFFEEKAAEFQNLESKSISQYDSIKQIISDRQNALTHVHETEELFQILDGFKNPADNPFTQEKERLMNIKKDLKQRKNKLEETLEASSPSFIFPVFEKIKKDLPPKKILNVTPPNLTYIESLSNGSYFGSIVPVPGLKLVRTFTIELPDISGIVTLNAETITIYSAKIKSFQYLTISNFEMRKLFDYERGYRQFDKSIRVVDMTAYRGNILISDESIDKEIMHICHSVSQTKFTSINDQLEACGVHTARDTILVGYCSSHKSTRKSGIITLNSIGTEIRRFECSASSDRLFTFPAKITTNLNNDICIIDYKSFYLEKNPEQNCRNYTYKPRNGRVVTLGEWGQPKWTYTGHASVNSNDNSFTPHDIVTTMHGHILIADRDSSTIHVVSKDGQFITFFRHEEIVHPVSLNIDKMGRLLIGCSSDWDGGNHKDDAGRCQTSKLHVSELV
ncbi:uncharacterized protein [Mytilus edulis]|uniref:uncharacterized protein n=1 Tax=Mytilus edulis TaxID=6550 RepID=UPI0039EE6EF8